MFTGRNIRETIQEARKGSWKSWGRLSAGNYAGERLFGAPMPSAPDKQDATGQIPPRYLPPGTGHTAEHCRAPHRPTGGNSGHQGAIGHARSMITLRRTSSWTRGARRFHHPLHGPLFPPDKLGHAVPALPGR